MKETDRIRQIFEERKELFTKKNENYGNSFRKTGQILKIIFEEPIKLETEKDYVTFGLVVRKLDKLVRYCNLRFTGEKDKVGESIKDTIGDDGVYSFILQGVEEE